MPGARRRMIGEPVAEGIGRVDGGFVNAYVLEDPGGLRVIDATLSASARPVRKAFSRAGVGLEQVRSILLTHWHPDHVRGASTLHEVSRAAVACHAADAPCVDGRQRPRLPLLLRLLARPRPVPVAREIGDGEAVGPCRVVFAPGHTAGEVAFYLPERRILFSGDAVVERRGSLTLPAPKAATDLAQAVASLGLLRKLPVELLLPGHGRPVRTDVAGALDDLIARAPREFLHAEPR